MPQGQAPAGSLYEPIKWPSAPWAWMREWGGAVGDIQMVVDRVEVEAVGGAEFAVLGGAVGLAAKEAGPALGGGVDPADIVGAVAVGDEQLAADEEGVGRLVGDGGRLVFFKDRARQHVVDGAFGGDDGHQLVVVGGEEEAPLAVELADLGAVEVDLPEAAGQGNDLLALQVRVDAQEAAAGHAVVDLAVAGARVDGKAAVEVDFLGLRGCGQRGQIPAMGKCKGGLAAQPVW